MDPLENVTFIQGDFTDDEPLALLEEALNGQTADLVLSDMAPNMSGMGLINHAPCTLQSLRSHLQSSGWSLAAVLLSKYSMAKVLTTM
jgi:23S rRNA (uridine2552-2'-O)-methyltransferase